MEFKTPKELEKVPIVMGFELIKVVMILASALYFLFLFANHFVMSLVLPVLTTIYILIDAKFARSGELISFLKYIFSPKIIRFNKTIQELLIQTDYENE